MTEPLSTIVGAKILDQLLKEAFAKGSDAIKSLLGGASQALTDAKAELDKEAAQRAKRMEAIVQQAAEELRPALSLIKLETGKDHSSLFQHSGFVTRVAEPLLLGTRFDLPAVRAQVLADLPDDRYPGLSRPLVLYFDRLNRLLEEDPQWGPALHLFRIDAQIAGIDASALQLVALAEQIAGTLDAQPERTAEAIHRPEKMRLEAWEASYLRRLYARCNKLPLEEKRAQDIRPPDAIGPAPRSFRLQHVGGRRRPSQRCLLSCVANSQHPATVTTAASTAPPSRWWPSVGTRRWPTAPG
jgi:hypothetical protein